MRSQWHPHRPNVHSHSYAPSIELHIPPNKHGSYEQSNRLLMLNFFVQIYDTFVILENSVSTLMEEVIFYQSYKNKKTFQSKG